MSKTPDITVAIPTYNRDKELIDTIHGILNQSHRNLELLVIDQTVSHSADTKQKINNINDPRFRYVQADPPSLPAARNLGLKICKAPIILFIDDDVVVDKDLVKYHLQAFREHPDVSAIGGRVLQKGFPIQKEVLRFNEFAVSHGVFTATDPSYTNAFPGGNCSLKVKEALSLGGFDTHFYGSAFREESDMSLKMTRAGMKIFYEPRAALTHLASHSGGTRTTAYVDLYDTKLFYRNEFFFTIRATKTRNLLPALARKYLMYCRGFGRKTNLKRSWYFGLGIIGAFWRIIFGRQTITRERTK